MQDIPEDSGDLISAYVDGELSSAARAEVLARAARDGQFARELATMTRLKASLEGAVPVPEIAVPHYRERRIGAWGIAAALAMMIAGGTGWVFFGSDWVRTAPERIEWAVVVHRGWAAADAEASGRAEVKVPASLAVVPHVPDLSANGLALAHAAVTDTPAGGRALILGYLGSRGCRVTLLAADAAAGPPQPPGRGATDLRARSWRSGNVAYLILAEGMSPDRFALIADSIERATRKRAPLGPETRMALRRNRAASPPCLT